MRHGMVNRKLGRKSGHRIAMFRNQLASLIESERIITTLPKAKDLRPQIERLVTLAKTDNVHNRRQAARVLIHDVHVARLFETIGPRFTERPGGYTRIIKLGARRGDASEMAILEFVDYVLAREEAPAAPAKGKAKKAAAAADSDAEEVKEEAPKKKAAPKKAPAKKEAASKEAAPAKETKKKAAPKKKKDE